MQNLKLFYYNSINHRFSSAFYYNCGQISERGNIHEVMNSPAVIATNGQCGKSHGKQKNKKLIIRFNFINLLPIYRFYLSDSLKVATQLYTLSWRYHFLRLMKLIAWSLILRSPGMRISVEFVSILIAKGTLK